MAVSGRKKLVRKDTTVAQNTDRTGENPHTMNATMDISEEKWNQENGRAERRERVCKYKEKTAYECRISDWSSDVCASDPPTLSMPVDPAFSAWINGEWKKSVDIGPLPRNRS